MGKRKLIPTLAHADSEDMTLRDVEVPRTVPLLADFERNIGTARLRAENGRVYAMLELLFITSAYGDSPRVFLGFEDTTAVEEGNTLVVTGGRIVSASIVSEEEWMSIYGEIQMGDEIPWDLSELEDGDPA